MDPQACWQRYCAAIRSHEWDTAAEARDDYNGWIGRGGFPAVDGSDSVTYIVNDAGDYCVSVEGDIRRRNAFRPLPRRWSPVVNRSN